MFFYFRAKLIHYRSYTYWIMGDVIRHADYDRLEYCQYPTCVCYSNSTYKQHCHLLWLFEGSQKRQGHLGTAYSCSGVASQYESIAFIFHALLPRRDVTSVTVNSPRSVVRPWWDFAVPRCCCCCCCGCYLVPRCRCETILKQLSPTDRRGRGRSVGRQNPQRDTASHDRPTIREAIRHDV